MESTVEIGHIQVTGETAGRLRDHFRLEPRGVEFKGVMETWYLPGRTLA